MFTYLYMYIPFSISFTPVPHFTVLLYNILALVRLAQNPHTSAPFGQFNEQNTSLNHFHVSFTWLIPWDERELTIEHFVVLRDIVVFSIVNVPLFFSSVLNQHGMKWNENGSLVYVPHRPPPLIAPLHHSFNRPIALVSNTSYSMLGSCAYACTCYRCSLRLSESQTNYYVTRQPK